MFVEIEESTTRLNSVVRDRATGGLTVLIPISPYQDRFVRCPFKQSEFNRLWKAFGTQILEARTAGTLDRLWDRMVANGK